MFLRRYQPTLVPRRKGPVTESQPESSQEPEETENKKPRGVYKSYSLRQKLEIVKFARENSEHSASRRLSRSTIYGWKDIDKEPATKKKVSTTTKGNIRRRVLEDTSPIRKRLTRSCCHGCYIREISRLPSEDKTSSSKQRQCFLKRCPSFKASNGWVDKFMCRHSWYIR